MLLELELPRLLAPDLPSNRSSLRGVNSAHCNPESEGTGPLFLVTTSLSQDWVIYASAAILRCGSRFSGSLSGIEP